MSQRARRRGLLILGVGLALIAGAATAWLLFAPRGLENLTVGLPSQRGTALVGGSFELTDQNGQVRRDEDFLGGYSLIYFGYTYCPDVCPTALTVMSQALDMLEERAPGRAAGVTPLFITIDPARDSVAVLADYAVHFHARLVALTGTPEQVAEAAKAYRVYFAKAGTDEEEDYLMDHTSIVYLMDREGKYLRHFTHASDAVTIAEALQAALEP